MQDLPTTRKENALISEIGVFFCPLEKIGSLEKIIENKANRRNKVDLSILKDQYTF